MLWQHAAIQLGVWAFKYMLTHAQTAIILYFSCSPTEYQWWSWWSVIQLWAKSCGEANQLASIHNANRNQSNPRRRWVNVDSVEFYELWIEWKKLWYCCECEFWLKKWGGLDKRISNADKKETKTWNVCRNEISEYSIWFSLLPRSSAREHQAKRTGFAISFSGCSHQIKHFLRTSIVALDS